MIVVRRGQPRHRLHRTVDADDVFRALMSGRGQVGAHGQGPWRPPVDVYETPDAIEIVVEIAGMDREGFEITLEGEIVSVRGRRPDLTQCDHRSFHEARISYGAFAVDVFVPFSVNPDLSKAEYENGFLKITLPRSKGQTIVPTRSPGTAGSSADDTDRSTT